MGDWAVGTGGDDAASWGRRLLWMFGIAGGEGGMVSVGTLTMVAFVAFVVAQCGLLGGFLGLGLWLRCVLVGCTKSVRVCFERLESDHLIGSVHNEAVVCYSLSRTKDG